MTLELFLGLLTILGMFAILLNIITKQAAQIRRLCSEKAALEKKNSHAQAEIRELESKLFDATTKPIRICEACAIYPCKCE